MTRTLLNRCRDRLAEAASLAGLSLQAAALGAFAELFSSLPSASEQWPQAAPPSRQSYRISLSQVGHACAFMLADAPQLAGGDPAELEPELVAVQEALSARKQAAGALRDRELTVREELDLTEDSVQELRETLQVLDALVAHRELFASVRDRVTALRSRRTADLRVAERSRVRVAEIERLVVALEAHHDRLEGLLAKELNAMDALLDTRLEAVRS